MQKIKIYILLFCLAISIPLSYLVWRTYTGLEQEERGQLRFFAETLFDDMEKELGELVQREEGRKVDEYNNTIASPDNQPQQSPLASLPKDPYIVGYLQNNPDGSLQTPLVADLRQVPASFQPVVEQLRAANAEFNRKKYTLPDSAEPASPAPELAQKMQYKEEKKGFADRYLASTQRKTAKKSSLGQQSVRVEKITRQQAANIAAETADEAMMDLDTKVAEQEWYDVTQKPSQAPASRLSESFGRNEQRPRAPQAVSSAPVSSDVSSNGNQQFQVEVTPLQSVFINDGRIFIFRRVAMNQQIYRQGFIIEVNDFLRHLAQAHFNPHPIAGFTRLSLMVMDHGRQVEMVGSGHVAGTAGIVAGRTFPAPFNFISAAILGQGVPASATRRILTIATVALAIVMLIGMFTIYQSVRSVVELSERRSQFVSSVTHELKTPLTNIRMYVEMLEQGIAATPEREQEYLGIIGSESGRLSRLINNVLELSKLEKKQRLVHMEPGRLEEVLSEVHSVMSPKLDQEGFELIVPSDRIPQFSYDREAMIQIFINLIENSIKFGRSAQNRCISIKVATENEWINISVSDTGPGIPRQSLSKVFDDFYRADNALTRSTGGTGIGLALVKKLIQAMGGRVRVANNDGPGCTITLTLPLSAR